MSSLTDFLTAILAEGGEIAKDAAFETAFDMFISNYRNLCAKMADRYLQYEGSDEELLATFRERILRMIKISIITIEEIDVYVTGDRVEIWGRVKEPLRPRKKLRRLTQRR